MKNSFANPMTRAVGKNAPALGNGSVYAAAVTRPVVLTVNVVLISLITILVSTG